MIDLLKLRQDPETIISLILKKEPSAPIRMLYELDSKVRDLKLHVEQLRQKKNELAELGKSGVTSELREKASALGKELKEKEAELREVEEQFTQVHLSCPNIPNKDLPIGGKDANLVIAEYGKKRVFDFPIKNHLELGTNLGWFDFAAASTMTGANFALYKGEAVKLMYALTMYMLDNNISYGYEAIIPPYLVNAKSLEVASNFPKFKDQVYAIKDEDLYLTPTAEVNITNMYRNAIFAADELPKRFTAWTSCFRREAGAYGATERGLIRMHQFEKVELYSFCMPDKAEEEQEKMLSCVRKLLDGLQLHYRVSLLAMQDCSFPSAKTYDVEVWLPGQDRYYEVSSISNCTDYQARRGSIRYRETAGGKTALVNTLNGSCLALSRLMVALMENNQQKDGSITLPSLLKNYGLYRA